MKITLIYTYQWYICTSKMNVKGEVSFRNMHTKNDTSIKKNIQNLPKKVQVLVFDLVDTIVVNW